MEVLYKKLTGEFAKFSEQYFVDCSFPYSGCEGGDTKVGLRLTRMRQYLVYEEDWPYTANCMVTVIICFFNLLSGLSIFKTRF